MKLYSLLGSTRFIPLPSLEQHRKGKNRRGNNDRDHYCQCNKWIQSKSMKMLIKSLNPSDMLLMYSRSSSLPPSSLLLICFRLDHHHHHHDSLESEVKCHQNINRKTYLSRNDALRFLKNLLSHSIELHCSLFVAAFLCPNLLMENLDVLRSCPQFSPSLQFRLRLISSSGVKYHFMHLTIDCREKRAKRHHAFNRSINQVFLRSAMID